MGKTLLVLVLLLLGVGITWRVRLGQRVEKRLAAIRAAGLPSNGADCDRWYAAVPTAENAALVVTQAIALLRDLPDWRSNEVARLKLPPRQPPSAEEAQLLVAELELNAAALAKLREGIRLPRSRYPVDLTLGYQALLPHLPPVKRLVRLCWFQTVLAAEAGDSPRAAAATKDLVGLARTLEPEPMLISFLIRTTLLNLAREGLERTLNAGKLSEEELADLTRVFAADVDTNGLVRALISEQANAIPCFRMSLGEMQRLGASFQGGPQASSNTALDGLSRQAFWLSGFFERDLVFYLNVMDHYMQRAALGPPRSLVVTGEAQEINNQITRHRYIISGILLPGFPQAFTRQAEASASMRIAATALAIERFRLVEGRLPDQLSALAPRFTASVPEDPFAGVPLRYRQLDRGFVVYSVGPDGRDDNGKEPPQRRGPRQQVEVSDITFTVTR